jgi:hypothetical protein
MSSSTLPPVQVIVDFQDICSAPVKRIFTGDDIPAWLESEALARLATVMHRLNSAIRGKRVDQGDADQSEVSLERPGSLLVLSLLDSDRQEHSFHARRIGQLDRGYPARYASPAIWQSCFQRLGCSFRRGLIDPIHESPTES